MKNPVIIAISATVKGWATVAYSDGTTRKLRGTELAAARALQSNVQPGTRKIGTRTADVSHYERVNGSLDCGDRVAVKLRGKTLDEVYDIVASVVLVPVNELKTRYAHLNVGMQRMNLGNVLRGAL